MSRMTQKLQVWSLPIRNEVPKVPPMSEPFQQYIAPAVSALAGFVGVAIGAWLTSKREQAQRKLKFIEDQLSLFYSPLWGIKNTIHRNAELRETLQEIGQEQWALLCTETEALSPEEKQKITFEKWPKFKKLLEYDDQKFEEELFPLYQEMLECFRKNYWLADEETRNFYPTLLQYVDVWNRNLKDALPYEVWKSLDHKESHLLAFYEHLEAKHNELSEMLRSGTTKKPSAC